jgi:hypothetical protein
MKTSRGDWEPVLDFNRLRDAADSGCQTTQVTRKAVLLVETACGCVDARLRSRQGNYFPWPTVSFGSAAPPTAPRNLQ